MLKEQENDRCQLRTLSEPLCLCLFLSKQIRCGVNTISPALGIHPHTLCCQTNSPSLSQELVNTGQYLLAQLGQRDKKTQRGFPHYRRELRSTRFPSVGGDSRQSAQQLTWPPGTELSGRDHLGACFAPRS
uniref:Uncharacterized protein n=1 Tax=Sphaerodactylus townsendi TaxID=933632 RepID=A0ACB8FZI5_9SAUR